MYGPTGSDAKVSLQNCAAVKVLFLTTVLPGGLRGGGEIVAHSVISALTAGGHEVSALGYRRPQSDAPALPGEICVGVRPIETAAAGRHRALAWMAKALAAGEPYSSAKYRSRAYVRAVRAAMAAGPDVVFVDHAQTRFAARRVGRPSPPLVFLAHNAEGDMYAQAADGRGSRAHRWANRREAGRIREAESELAHRAAQTWVLTEDDAHYFRELCPDGDVRVLQVASLMGQAPQALAPPAACDIALIGTWNWGPNARGLEWFSAEVVPRLPEETKVEVAGAGAEWLIGRHPNVTVRGTVPDAEAFISAARVVAVPSVAGGGVQVKTLDAIACGASVVATPTATRGLGELPESVAVAERGAQFASELVRLAASPEHDRLRAGAIAWSKQRRERLASLVTSFVAELAGAHAEPAGV